MGREAIMLRAQALPRPPHPVPLSAVARRAKTQS